jgi:ubiquinone/menaquinone biosynthesis C-methylase UbiE
MAGERLIDHRGHLDVAELDAHDRQKDWPADLWSSLVEGLQPKLTDPCLEIGVGSGLVALRLWTAGTTVIGLDFNRSMLSRLAERLPDAPAVQGDALHLPFGSATGGSVVLSNVLHLIPDWRGALTEIARVIRTGGSLVVNLGAGGTAPPEVREVRRRFLSHFDDLGSGHGPTTEDELTEALAGAGFEAATPVTASGTTHRTLREVITRLERNPFAWPSGTPREVLESAAADVRDFALAQFGSIDEPLEHRATVRFSSYTRS